MRAEPTADDAGPFLALRDLRKSFGATRALDGASLLVERGTVHGLIGQNGAGKSTIVKILGGLETSDAGTIALDGRVVVGARPRHIERLGVHVIHQEPMLVPGATVAEALFLGRERRRGPFASARAMRRLATETIEARFGLVVPGGAPVDTLGSAERQIVQITRALLCAPRVLVFDEPTASLVRAEAERLFAIIRRLRDEGTAVVYVSHYLEEVRDLCGSITVLRGGRDVATVAARGTSVADLAAMMVDRAIGEVFPARTDAVPPGRPLLAARGLARAGLFADVSFELRAGEILGLTGLVGSGAKDVLHALFGLAPADGGTLFIRGRAVRLRSTVEAVRLGLGLVPEDRRRHGVAVDASVAESATLPRLDRFVRWGLLDRRRERSAVAALIERLGIRTAGPDAAVRTLSGGNQQKVVLAKWLGADASIFLLDEPTVAVDIASKIEIYRLLDRLATEGVGVLLLSTDLDELRGLADRILVMNRGRVEGAFARGAASPEEILACASGGPVEAAA